MAYYWHHAYIIPYLVGGWGCVLRLSIPGTAEFGGRALGETEDPGSLPVACLPFLAGHLVLLVISCTYVCAWRIRMTIRGSMRTEGV